MHEYDAVLSASAVVFIFAKFTTKTTKALNLQEGFVYSLCFVQGCNNDIKNKGQKTIFLTATRMVNSVLLINKTRMKKNKNKLKVLPVSDAEKESIYFGYEQICSIHMIIVNFCLPPFIHEIKDLHLAPTTFCGSQLDLFFFFGSLNK